MLFALPGRMLGALLGGAVRPPAGDSPLVQDLESDVAAEHADAVDNYKKIADAIWAWAMDSLVADAPAPVPAWLPRDVKSWLPGLTREEAEILVSSEKAAIEAHIRRGFGINGVRSVGPLEPVWSLHPEPTAMPAPEFFYAPPRDPRDLRRLLS
jgi:hypothetical protein